MSEQRASHPEHVTLRSKPELVRLEPRHGSRPSAKPPVRIYLGTEDAQYRAERVFFYSIERVRDPGRTYDVYLMKNVSGFSTKGWRTQFTNYRFGIPDFADRQGRAIYNDVDQIYLADPAELFDLDMGARGYLAVSAQDTSVMLLDCARMARWWNLERAQQLDKSELLAGPAAEPGLWGALDGTWNARDLEYVEGRSKCVHFTALHTQPWQPTPGRYSYHRHPIADVWDRLERAADTDGYEIFGHDHPSAGFADAAAAARAGAGRYTPPTGQAQAWLEQKHPLSVLRCSLGPAAFPSANGAELADLDLAAASRRVPGTFDAVIAAGLLERAPLEDVPWILDEIFTSARKDVYVAVVSRASRDDFGSRSAEWWREQLRAAARRHRGPGWRLDVFTPTTDGRPAAAFAAPGAHEIGTPKVWVLRGSKTGDNRQVVTLAEALGWPYETKQLEFNTLHHLPPLLLDESLASLDRAASTALEPPWPDFVISAGKRSVPVARWVRAQAGGRTRLVHLGRPWAPLEWFDLIITTPQYALPARPNILHNTMPLNRVTPEHLARAARHSRWREAIGALPAPRVAILVGGNSTSHALTVASAQRLGEQASDLVIKTGGSLLVTTSPRTPAAALEALRRSITAPVLFHAFGEPPENAYDAFLALADGFIVTGDSASMLAEACSTGKPVHIYALPRTLDLVPGARALLDLAQSLGARRVTPRGTPKQQDALARLYDRFVELGLITPSRNLDAYHAALEARGLASRIGHDSTPISPTGPDDLARAVEHVRDLLHAERRIAV